LQLAPSTAATGNANTNAAHADFASDNFCRRRRKLTDSRIPLTSRIQGLISTLVRRIRETRLSQHTPPATSS